MTTVTIERSEHQHPQVPRGVVQLVERELERRGIQGVFRLHWGPRFKGGPHTPRFGVVGLTSRNNVELQIKPGGNDTAHTVWLESAAKEEDENFVTMDELLIAIRSKPSDREPASPGESFTKDPSCVKGALRVLAALGGYGISINPLKEQLSEVYPQVTNRGWGKILATLERRGLLIMNQNAHGDILEVSLAPAGAKQLNGHAPPLPGSALALALEQPPAPVTESAPSLPESASPPPALGEWLRALARKEEELLADLLEAERLEIEVRERVVRLRSALDATSARAQAARVLLGGDDV